MGKPRHLFDVYCLYCNANHGPTTVFSDEHVLPDALGVPRSFSIRVCKDSNSLLGKEVDAKIVDDFIIRWFRHDLRVRSRNGIPDLVLDGVLKTPDDVPTDQFHDGRRIKVAYGADGTHRLFIPPEVRWTDLDDGRKMYDVRASSEEQYRAILDGINRKSPNNKLDVDALLATALAQNETFRPWIAMTHDYVPAVWARAYAKFALALAHFELGEAYSRGPEAQALRHFVMTGDVSARHDTVRVFVEPDGVDRKYGIEPLHTLALVPGADSDTRCVIVLFGKFCASVRLSMANYARSTSALRGHLIDPTAKSWSVVPLEDIVRRARESWSWTGLAP